MFYEKVSLKVTSLKVELNSDNPEENSTTENQLRLYIIFSGQWTGSKEGRYGPTLGSPRFLPSTFYHRDLLGQNVSIMNSGYLSLL